MSPGAQNSGEEGARRGVEGDRWGDCLGCPVRQEEGPLRSLSTLEAWRRKQVQEGTEINSTDATKKVAKCESPAGSDLVCSWERLLGGEGQESERRQEKWRSVEYFLEFSSKRS